MILGRYRPLSRVCSTADAIVTSALGLMAVGAVTAVGYSSSRIQRAGMITDQRWFANNQHSTVAHCHSLFIWWLHYRRVAHADVLTTQRDADCSIEKQWTNYGNRNVNYVANSIVEWGWLLSDWTFYRVTLSYRANESVESHVICVSSTKNLTYHTPKCTQQTVIKKL